MRLKNIGFVAFGAIVIGGCSSSPGSGDDPVDGTDPVDPFLSALEELACASGQVAKFDGTDWVCAEDSDTLAALTCTSGQVPLYQGSQWICTDTPETISDLSCAEGQVLKHLSGGWQCTEDNDSTLTATEVLDHLLALDSDDSGLNATTLQGLGPDAFATSDHAHLLATHYVPAGGNAAENGAALTALMGSISGPARVQLDAGTYELAATLAVPANVHVAGAGRGITVVAYPHAAATWDAAAVIDMADDTELRSLTIKNTDVVAIPDSMAGVRAVGADVRLVDLAVEVSGNVTNTAGVYFDMGDASHELQVERCRIVVSGGWSRGIMATNGAASISGTTVWVHGSSQVALLSNECDVIVRNSRLETTGGSAIMSIGMVNYGSIHIHGSTLKGDLEISGTRRFVLLRHSTWVDGVVVGPSSQDHCVFTQIVDSTTIPEGSSIVYNSSCDGPA